MTRCSGGDIPYLYTSVIDNCENDELVVFAVNRSLDEDMELEISLGGFEGYVLDTHTELYSDDLNTTNTKDNEAILPVCLQVEPERPIVLKKHSWNMLTYKRK